MWGEGAGDPSGHLEEEKHEREAESPKRERKPFEDDAKPTDQETDEALGAAGLDPV